MNPALDGALEILQNFAIDVRNGKISDDRLRFGAPWRHPPKVDDPKLRMEWAKLQLMDFVKSLVNADFGVNVLIFFSFKILFVENSSIGKQKHTHVHGYDSTKI